MELYILGQPVRGCYVDGKPYICTVDLFNCTRTQLGLETKKRCKVPGLTTEEKITYKDSQWSRINSLLMITGSLDAHRVVEYAGREKTGKKDINIKRNVRAELFKALTKHGKECIPWE